MDNRIVEIHWRDTWADGHNRTLEEIEYIGYIDTFTYGVLIEDSPNTYKVVQTIWVDSGEIAVTRNLFVIPKMAVEGIRTLVFK